MKIRLLAMYNGLPPGRILDAVSDGVALVLIQRGIAEICADDADADADGRRESGPNGQQKAFTSPPKWREKRHRNRE